MQSMQIKTLKEREKDHLFQVLAKTAWDLQKTALLLQVSVSEVRRKIKEHGLQKLDSGRSASDERSTSKRRGKE